MSMDIKTAYSLFLIEYPDILEVPHLCKILGGINKSTVYDLIKSGEIQSMKIGKKYLTPKINILKFLNILEQEA